MKSKNIFLLLFLSAIVLGFSGCSNSNDFGEKNMGVTGVDVVVNSELNTLENTTTNHIDSNIDNFRANFSENRDISKREFNDSIQRNDTNVQQRDFKQMPQEMIDSCNGLSTGDGCSFSFSNQDNVETGTCVLRDEILSCMVERNFPDDEDFGERNIN